MADGGEAMGGLEAEPGRAPVLTAVFSGHGGGPSTALWAEIGPTKVLGGGKEPGGSSRGPKRQKSVKSSVAKES